MTYEVVLTRGAQRDLLKLYDYIAERSSETRASGYIERIQIFCRSLGAMPFRGTSREDLKKGLRVIGFERRVAVDFQVRGQRVAIARVRYGGRDVDAALKRP